MSKKLEEMETALAFMERKMDELSEVLYRQQLQLDLQEKKLQQLQDELKNTREDIADKRPPHY